MSRIVTLFSLSFFIALAGLGGSQAGCSGPSEGVFEGGNPALRTVQGKVAAADGGSCEADETIAIDSGLAQTTASVDAGCEFSLELTVGKAYSISLYLSDLFVAKMTFENDAETTSDYFLLAEGETPIDLGTVTINGTTATPEIQPGTQSDWDGDGVVNWEDPDDDNDGTPDALEEDCDGDGVSDDLDEDTSQCFLLLSEIQTVDLSTGEDWEGQKKVSLSFQDTSGLTGPQSIRYRYGDITNPRMSISKVSGDSLVPVVAEGLMEDDPVGKILCGIIDDFETGVEYQAFIIGDPPGTLEMTWEEGDTCGNPWPS